MPAEQSPRQESRLAVVEGATAFFVVWEDTPDDWLARFDKSAGFPARAWAENMVRVYNRRLAEQDDTPPSPPGDRPGNYHP